MGRERVAVVTGNRREYDEFIRICKIYKINDHEYFYVSDINRLFGFDRGLRYILFGQYEGRKDFRDICDRLRILAGRDLTSATMLYIKL